MKTRNCCDRVISLCAAALWLLPAIAVAASARGSAALTLFDDVSEVPPLDKAFVLDAAMLDESNLLVRFTIHPGTYLYRDKLKFSLLGDDVSLGVYQLPPGQSHSDEFFGTSVVYRNIVEINLPIHRYPGAHQVILKIAYQGCADAGVCYPPQVAERNIVLDGGSS